MRFGKTIGDLNGEIDRFRHRQFADLLFKRFAFSNFIMKSFCADEPYKFIALKKPLLPLNQNAAPEFFL